MKVFKTATGLFYDNTRHLLAKRAGAARHADCSEHSAELNSISLIVCTQSITTSVE